ncbi:MAG: heme-binding protein [Alphaproteobacteria bacterium]|nr:heme-binding protein [Alphaproteobacteria bacterium]
MRMSVLFLAAASMALPALVAASAQPLPAPASYPPVVGAKGVVTTHEMSLDMAEKIARAGIEKCRQLGYHTTMVVVDSSGTMKAFLRDDQTGPHTINLAQDKAYTALTLANRFATSLNFSKARGGTLGTAMPNVRGLTTVGGGVPIKYHGETIGAVASSGAVGADKDEICSQAGIDAVAADLK